MSDQARTWDHPEPPTDLATARLETVRALHRASVTKEQTAAYAALQGVRSRYHGQRTVGEIADRLVLTFMADARELDATAALLATW